MVLEASLLIEAQHLKKYFPSRTAWFRRERPFVRAVDDVSFRIEEGETLGLVGESGCGKSTTGRLLLRLLKPTSGRIIFEGKNVSLLSSRELRELRRHAQIIFQDPYASLNPRMRVKDILAEPFVIHRMADGRALTARVEELLERVGLERGAENRFPHEFSGGQRQRIAIARAIALKPKFIVADEPVSSLDVSIQAQILNLLKDLQSQLRLTYLFISHSLPVVRHLCDRVAIMYLGQIVEEGSAEEIFCNPRHPYTRALLAAVPEPNPDKPLDWIWVRGESASAIHLPPGCRFHPRCPIADENCSRLSPPFELLAERAGHGVACFKAEEEFPSGFMKQNES